MSDDDMRASIDVAIKLFDVDDECVDSQIIEDVSVVKTEVPAVVAEGGVRIEYEIVNVELVPIEDD